MEDRTSLLQEMAFRRHLGEDALSPAQASGVRLNRNPQPSAAIADSQSIKTTGVGGDHVVTTGPKKVKGRKRHILVDTQGLVLEVRVHGAQIQDRDGIKLLLDMNTRDRLPERLPPVAGRWIHWPGEGRRMGPEGFGVDRRDRAPS